MYQFLPPLLPSISREICQRLHSSAWIRPFRVKAVVRNLYATKKVLEKCKDHVNTSGIFDTNRIPFAVLFLCSRINFCWHQYKCQNQVVKDLLPQFEFKLSFERVLMTPELSWILPGAEEVYKVKSHLILSRKTQALAQMEYREREIDIWDALVKKTTNSLQTPILREIDQCCPWNNCPTHTIAAKFLALSTWDPWDEPSTHSEKAPA